MVIIIMGVAGSGKSTIGQLLARDLGWPFYEGDQYHPAGNVEKMKEGEPLTDTDRAPWLSTLASLISNLFQIRQSAVIACSALKQDYRNVLSGGNNNVRFVYLKAAFDLAKERLLERTGHFMKADLLQSQFDTLEEPAHAVTLDAAAAPQAIVERIRAALAL